MATLAELVSSGFMKITSPEYEYQYNELYTELTETVITLKEIGSRWKRQKESDDVDVTCTRGSASDDLTVNNYGRPCIYLNWWDDVAYIRNDLHGESSFNNAGCNIYIYAADENGNSHKYKENITFPYNETVNSSYSGEDENVRTICKSQCGTFGYGKNYMSDNAPWINLYGKFGHFETSIPIFTNLDDVSNYIETGVPENAVNPYAPPEPEFDLDGYEYYYEYSLYDCNTVTHQKTTQIGETKTAKFKSANNGAYVAFVRKSDGTLKLESSDNYILIYNEETGQFDNKVVWETVGLTAIDGELDGEYGDLFTNIPIVDNLEDAKDIEPSYPSYNGVDSSMENNIVSNLVSFINCYYVNNAELLSIGEAIYNSDADAITALKEGLWMYNENPIESIIDVCYYPFSLTPFISGTGSKKLKFGSFVCDGTVESLPTGNYEVITATNKPFTIINQRIVPVYNDFRDYNSITYTLYLPYAGMIPIDNTVIGNNLKVDVYFDIFTSTLKFYIYVNKSLYDTVECSVGKHMAVTGNNWVTKSASNINDRLNAYTGSISTGAGIGAGAANGSGSNIVGSVLGWFQNTLNSNMNYLSKPSTVISGSTSSGMNIFDPMNCYLIIEQYQTIKPSNLNSEYGKPTYKINKISTCKGFTQISDCKLNTHATRTEQDEILNLLRNGIII